MRYRFMGWIASVLLWPAAVSAQVTVSPYAGGMIYDGSLMIVEDGAIQASGIENRGFTPVVGLRIGYSLARRWAPEVSYGRSLLENEDGRLTGHLAYVTLQYSVVSTARWTASLGAGGGVIGYQPRAANLRAMSDPLIAGGVGASYTITSSVDVRTDLRFFGQFCRQEKDRDGLSCNYGSQLGYSEWSGGLRFRL